MLWSLDLFVPDLGGLLIESCGWTYFSISPGAVPMKGSSLPRSPPLVLSLEGFTSELLILVSGFDELFCLSLLK